MVLFIGEAARRNFVGSDSLIMLASATPVATDIYLAIVKRLHALVVAAAASCGPHGTGKSMHNGKTAAIRVEKPIMQ